MNKFPKGRNRIVDIDKRIHEIEGLFDTTLNDLPLGDLNVYLDTLAHLMYNKYYGPFRLQGQSYREQCKERKVRKELNQSKYRARDSHLIKDE